MTPTDMGWLVCNRCGCTRPPNAVIKTLARVQCMDTELCARLQVHRLFELGARFLQQAASAIKKFDTAMAKTKRILARVAKQNGIDLDAPLPLGKEGKKIAKESAKERDDRTMADEWVVFVWELRHSNPKIGDALHYARSARIENPHVMLTYAYENQRYRRLVFERNKALVERIISKRFGFAAELVDGGIFGKAPSPTAKTRRRSTKKARR